MNDSTLSELSGLFLALSDKTRLRLIDLMAKEAVSVGFLAESINESQPKVSRHLAYLRNAGLVRTRRDGKNVFYSIEWPQGEIAASIMRVFAGEAVDSVVNTDRLTTDDRRNDSDIYVQTYINDYVPQEIEIHLL